MSELLNVRGSGQPNGSAPIPPGIVSSRPLVGEADPPRTTIVGEDHWSLAHIVEAGGQALGLGGAGSKVGPVSRPAPASTSIDERTTLQRVLDLHAEDANAVWVPSSLLLRIAVELAVHDAHEATDHLCRDCGRRTGATYVDGRLLCGACAMESWKV